LSNGNRVTIYNDDSRYENFKSFIADGLYEDAEKLDTKSIIQQYTKSYLWLNGFSLNIIDGVGQVNINGGTYPLSDVITNRIIKMESENLNATPLIAFLANLYNNPSKTAIDELFLFLDRTDLPITVDGHFIAYKIVQENYRDIYTGTMDNSIGNTVEMPRFSVDDKRSNTCSSGLHFCSKAYLNAYGSGRRDTDRCILVKINPADVVSIPSDYNNAKGRTCKYVVVGEVTSNDWRADLKEKDYNKSSVVDQDGNDYFLFEESENDETDIALDTFNEFFYYSQDSQIRWNDSDRPAKVEHIVNKLMQYAGMTEDDAYTWLFNHE
jgi:hypothetical protein